MKILAIGDIHGKPIWKKFVEERQFDRVVFLGDYFDSHDKTLTPSKQIDNFEEICRFAKKDDRVKLLVGNHDYHYFEGVRTQYSGYQYRGDLRIMETLVLHKDLLNLVYIEKDYIFSHAGVSKDWLELWDLKLENINEEFKKNVHICRFSDKSNSNPYGDDTYQPPTWIRPFSLLNNKVDNYKQVVGHTRSDALYYFLLDREIKEGINEFDGVYFCDCLDSVEECLELDI